MYGICDISCAPMRKEPSHRSEQVSELLFGDSFEILDEEKEWVQVRCSFDDYNGWIQQGQFTWYSGPEFRHDKKKFHPCSYDILQPALSPKRQIPVLIGSSLPGYDGMQCRINKENFTVSGRVTNLKKTANDSFLIKTAMQYYNAPYRWGGKTPFGIDCSGFTQMVFKMMNIRIPRDAWQQAAQGELVSLSEMRTGDLAFFGDEEKITHTGIILPDAKIIHSSGKVKIDRLDERGIISAESNKITHKLRMIKRITNLVSSD
jgi:hypothetical protein